MPRNIRAKALTRTAVAGALVWIVWFVWNPLVRIAPRTSPEFMSRPTNDGFVDAASKGDIQNLKRFLDSGVNVDSGSSGGEGRSALSAAANNQQLEAVKMLLSRGADVNADDFWGGNALTEAACNGSREIVDLLLAHRADPNANDDGASALDYASHQLHEPETAASRAEYVAIVQALKDHGAHSALFGLFAPMKSFLGLVLAFAFAFWGLVHLVYLYQRKLASRNRPAQERAS